MRGQQKNTDLGVRFPKALSYDYHELNSWSTDLLVIGDRVCTRHNNVWFLSECKQGFL